MDRACERPYCYKLLRPAGLNSIVVTYYITTIQAGRAQQLLRAALQRLHLRGEHAGGARPRRYRRRRRQTAVRAVESERTKNFMRSTTRYVNRFELRKMKLLSKHAYFSSIESFSELQKFLVFYF